MYSLELIMCVIELMAPSSELKMYFFFAFLRYLTTPLLFRLAQLARRIYLSEILAAFSVCKTVVSNSICLQ